MLIYELIVSGQVIGVGFRNYVAQVARQLNIKGNVRNLSDGRVKIIIEASSSSLNTFKHHIAVPQHPWMKVTNISVREIESTQDFTQFKIIY